MRSLQFIASSEDKEAEAVIAALRRYHPALAQKTVQKWADAYIERGEEAIEEGNWPAAETAFMKAEALDMPAIERIESAKAQLFSSKAWEQLRAGKPAEGLNDAQGAVARAPEDPNILDTRAQIYMALGRLDEAFVDLDKAITLGIRSASTYYAHGVIYEKRGKIALAIADYRKSLELSTPTEGDDGEWEKKAQDQAKARLLALESRTNPLTTPPSER